MRINKSLIAYTPTSGAGSGSVTSVALSAPTGFTVSGSPITSSGTLSLAFASGYSLPTTIKQGQWDDAYTFVVGFPSQTGNAGRYLSTDGSTLSWELISGTGIVGAALSTTNDANITITASGNNTTALLRTMTLTMGWNGLLNVSRGGTGASTLTGVVIGNGNSSMNAVAGTANQYLRRNSTNTAYQFGTIQGSEIAGSELTKTDDTNVTLSLGGTPASSLLQPVSLTLGWTGQLAVGRGGTGASTLTGVVIGNGTSAMTAVSGTAGQLLRRNAGNTAYEFFTASLISGNGVADRVAKWTSSTNLIDSQIIDDGTNVGIGVTPDAKLRVSGNINGTQAIFTNINGRGLQISTSLEAGTNDAGSILNARGASSGTLIFQTDSVEKARITPTGNLGIGVSPSWKLQIAPTSTYIGLNTGDGFAIYNPSLSGVNLVLGVNGSGVSQGALIQGRDGTGSTFSIQMQPYGGNVGIGISPSHKLDVNGNIGLAGKIFAGFGGVFHAIYDQSANQAITIGDSSNPNTYYAQTNHVFTDRPGTNTFGTFSSSGLVLSTGHLQLPSANYITFGGAYGTDIPTISGTSGGGSNGFLQFYPAGSSSGVKMALRRTGQLYLGSYTTSTSFSGTAVATLAVTNGGDVITIAPSQTTASGTYTPTWTGLANVGSVTAFSCQYMRVGDTVTVSGWVTIDAVADNTPTSLSFSLPINSNTTSVNYLNGTGVQQGGGAAASLSGYGANYGEFEVSPLVDTAVNYSFHFTYRII